MTNLEKQSFLTTVIISVIISGLIGGFAGFSAARSFTQSRPNQDHGQYVTPDQSSIVTVVEKATPAVVSIIITKDLPKITTFDPFSGTFNLPDPNQPTQKQEIGGGSGFIISSDGYVVTNKHVVVDTEAEYTVLLNNGDKHPAKVLARDPSNDLAILKIDGKNFPTLQLGDSDSLKVGQSVIAIGNALGEFRNTVSTGVVSGLARSITASSGPSSSERLLGLIQTDASINPGNSGGPLMDTTGQVIGINVAVAQGAQNIGFALPINQVKQTIESVRKNGRLVRAWLGVRYVLITPELAKANQLPKDYGALIIRGDQQTDLAIIPGSPADKAGLVEDDIILEVNGKKIDENNPLAQIVAQAQPGDTLTFKVLHKGSEKEVQIKLEEMKQ